MREDAAIEKIPVSPRQPVPRVPAVVTTYHDRAVASDLRHARQIRITQEGLMWLKPGAAPRRFTATQHLASDRVAFHWQARFHLLRVLPLTVVDAYADGTGFLELRVLGRRLQRQEGPEVSTGEAMRYLAELPWVPQALVRNPDLDWRPVDDRRVEVSIRAGSDPVAVTLEFDERGDIARATAPGRPYRSGRAGFAPTPWGGRFDDYRVLGGMRVPTRAEVAWRLPGGPFVYWRARVTSVIALDTPFAIREP
jgi:hypothetical protein